MRQINQKRPPFLFYFFQQNKPPCTAYAFKYAINFMYLSLHSNIGFVVSSRSPFQIWMYDYNEIDPNLFLRLSYDFISIYLSDFCDLNIQFFFSLSKHKKKRQSLLIRFVIKYSKYNRRLYVCNIRKNVNCQSVIPQVSL